MALSLQTAKRSILQGVLMIIDFLKIAFPLMGVRFNFSDFLKTFVVKQHGSWHEYKAYNKSTLKAFIYGRIEKNY